MLRKLLCVVVLCSFTFFVIDTFSNDEFSDAINMPSLTTDHAGVNRAFRISMGDLLGNVAKRPVGILARDHFVILAGLDYQRPWTRDASINAWNGASLIMPEISKNTLLSVLQNSGDDIRIGGQYWDAMVWAAGAWNHYLYTGDREFLETAVRAVKNSLQFFEATEFDRETGLFRGPGWSDGVAAYPDGYTAGKSSAILDWPKSHPDKISKPGYGIPMLALSTNCLYYNAYMIASKMAQETGTAVDPEWIRKATRLQDAINKHLWMPKKGYYRFFSGALGNCDYQESLGHAYAIMFGVANPEQTESIFKTQHITDAGVPCTWPTFARYQNEEKTSYGRHSGTVWPQIQGFWADAAARHKKETIFAHEFFRLTEHANRDQQFAEIYHPDSGEIYGGMQEAGEQRGIILWHATNRQTWAATAYIRMILLSVVGLRFDTDGLIFQPCLPDGISHLELNNIHYRNMIINITIDKNNNDEMQCNINENKQQKAFLGLDGVGEKNIHLY